MGSKKIDELNMEKILSKVGFPVAISEFRYAYKYNVNAEQAIEFEKKLTEMKDNYPGIIQVICDYEEIFDKEIYILHVARLLEKDLQEIKRADILGTPIKQQIYTGNLDEKNKRRFLVNAKELLKSFNSDVVDLKIDPQTGNIIIDSSQKFIGKKTSSVMSKEKSQERLKQIEDTIGITNLVEYLTPSDLINICKYPNLGNTLAVRLYKDNSKKQKGKKIKDGVHKVEKVVDDDTLSKGQIFDFGEFEETIKNYIEYIDIDKMLLLANAVYYNKYGIDFCRFDGDDAIQLKEFTKKVENLLEKKNPKVDSPRFITVVDFKTIRDSVESLNKHFINGRFYEDNEINDLAKSIIYGDVPYTTISKKEFSDIMQFTIGELSILVTNQPSSLQYFIENELLKENELEEIIKLKTDFTDEQVLYLISKGLIDYDNILNLYSQGKVSLENIKFIKENLKEKNLVKLVSEEKLIELYLDPNKKEEFLKYRQLYKTLKIDDATIEEKNKIAYELLDKSLELMEEEKIYDLYHMGLLPVDTIIDIMGKSAVTKLYSSGELKPTDAKRLYKDGIITDDMFKDIFQKCKLTDTEKIVLIYSTFPTIEEEDVKLREKFIKEYMPNPLSAKKQQSSDDVKENEQENNERNENYLSANRSVLDPCARWNLIGSLDKDYSQKYLKDGSILFYLPNKGKYIIEKLYTPSQKIAYGSATYILDENVFNDKKDEILQDEMIKSKNLVSLHKQHVKGVKKVIHTGWSNAIVKFFDIENSEKYTQEEINNIKTLAECVEKSKKPLSRDDD